MDPTHWGWARLAGASTAWVVVLAATGWWWTVARVIAHAKVTDPSGGDFVVVLPYGTRHLTVLVLVAVFPPLVALARKLLAG